MERDLLVLHPADRRTGTSTIVSASTPGDETESEPTFTNVWNRGPAADPADGFRRTIRRRIGMRIRSPRRSLTGFELGAGYTRRDPFQAERLSDAVPRRVRLRRGPTAAASPTVNAGRSASRHRVRSGRPDSRDVDLRVPGRKPRRPRGGDRALSGRRGGTPSSTTRETGSRSSGPHRAPVDRPRVRAGASGCRDSVGRIYLDNSENERKLLRTGTSPAASTNRSTRSRSSRRRPSSTCRFARRPSGRLRRGSDRQFARCARGAVRLRVPA